MSGLHLNYSDDLIRDIFAKVRTIAVVGASNKPERPSYGVAQFLHRQGYTVFAINPGLAGGHIGPIPVYTSLAEVPVALDMVDIFRNSDAAGVVVDEALKLSPLPKVIWMQLDVVNVEAARRAEARGVTMIMDRCPHIEIARLRLPKVG